MRVREQIKTLPVKEKCTAQRAEMLGNRFDSSRSAFSRRFVEQCTHVARMRPKNRQRGKKMHELLKERTKERKEETPVVANKKNIGSRVTCFRKER